jgi:threonine synthase
VLAQVVYYIHSCLHIQRHEHDKSVDFAVPTGNFGDIFAGYIAKRMLPEGTVHRLLLATNTNDILSRFVSRGDYSLGNVVATSSPSMDIQAASNFERYLYYLLDENPVRTKEAMDSFAATGKLNLSSFRDQIKRDFVASAASEQAVQETIRQFYTQHRYILDPHTAVGVYAALTHHQEGVPVICLATAHPAKFAETVTQAIGIEPEMPAALASLSGKPTRCEQMAPDRHLIQEFIRQHALIAS